VLRINRPGKFFTSGRESLHPGGFNTRSLTTGFPANQIPYFVKIFTIHLPPFPPAP